MSFGHPQLTHNGTHITRKGAVYYYRRRLPRPLIGEISFSLGTARFRLAEDLACRLDHKLSELLEADVRPVDLSPILRDYLHLTCLPILGPSET